MKRFYVLAFVLLLNITMSAQNRGLLLKETFDSTELPEGWYIDGHEENWSVSTSSKSGGDPNEMYLTWSPVFVDVSRLVMPAFDFTGISSVEVSFKHFHDNYIGTNTIGVATSSDNGATWNVAWSQSYTAVQAFVENITVETSDMGKDNVLMCIFFDGDSNLINGWYFDDIEVIRQVETDAELVSIDTPSIVTQGPQDLIFTVRNLGTKTIETFSVNLSVDYEDGYDTKTYNTNLASFESAQFVWKDAFNAHGWFQWGYDKPHILEFCIASVNGEADGFATNNFKTKEIYVAKGTSERVVLIEHFTSSACVYPCAAVNEIMYSLATANEGKCSYVKYPIDYPSADPYCTEESLIRKSYYAVTTTPHIFLDAVSQGYGSATDETFEDALQAPSYQDIRGTFVVEDSTVKVIADFMSYSELNNVRAYVSVNEKITLKNVINEEEPFYRHVMMKMSGDAQGEEISIKSGEYQRLECSLDMKSTFVEGINDLEVVMWLQNYDTKEVYNSHFAYATDSHVYPVENLMAGVGGDELTLYVEWDAPEASEPVAYNIYVDGILVVENYTELSYQTQNMAELMYSDNDFHVAEVVAIYANGMTSVPVAKIIVNDWVGEKEVEETRFNIYPNPAKDFVKLSSVNGQISSVKVYNCLGVLVEEIEVNSNEIEINTSDYSSGIYYISIEGNKFVKTERLIVL